MISALQPSDAARFQVPSNTVSSSALNRLKKTYYSNTDSDYTEKIEDLDKRFTYAENSHLYWNAPEFSLLYGTPLYEEASETQKIALNHLYWFSAYYFILSSENETIVYNKITGGVFAKIPGYEIVDEILNTESDQEVSHIHAFRKVCYQTLKSLLGKDAFRDPLKGKLKQNSLKKWAAGTSQSSYRMSRFFANQMLPGTDQYYSEYLKQLEEKEGTTPDITAGFMGIGLPPVQFLQFMSFNWGRTPFLASFYYTLRFAANLTAKHTETSNSKYFKKLKKQGEVIPVPTAISYYHFLDEAFHITTSRLLARDLYKDFPKPTAYEKFIANSAFYRLQSRHFGGLSAVTPDKHKCDEQSMMSFIYKILKSDIFGFSDKETLCWMEKCFCREHEGFHLNAKRHRNLLGEFRRTYGQIDYLWPANRELRPMEAGVSIERAVEKNKCNFERFCYAVAD